MKLIGNFLFKVPEGKYRSKGLKSNALQNCCIIESSVCFNYISVVLLGNNAGNHFPARDFLRVIISLEYSL